VLPQVISKTPRKRTAPASRAIGPVVYLCTLLFSAKAFQDGWFKTGDVGAWYPGGTISVIDRVKNLVKPPHGEYIALEKLESSYRKSPLVEQILLYADTKHYDCVAIIVPARDMLTQWASQNGLGQLKLEDLCKNPKAIAAVLKSVQETGRKDGVRIFSIVVKRES